MTTNIIAPEPFSKTTITYNEQRTVLQSVAVVGGGGSTAISLQCAEQLNAFTLVAVNNEGLIVRADSISSQYVLGMIKVAVDVGDIAKIYTTGEISNTGWNLIPNSQVYLGELGNITQSPSATANHIVVGIAITPIKMFLQIQPAVVRPHL